MLRKCVIALLFSLFIGELCGYAQTVQKDWNVAIRTNLLLPAFNVGVEVPLGNQWSVGADWYYPWMFRWADHKDCTQALALNLEGRYWFGKDRTRERRLTGHSVGLYAMAGYYDLERNYKGYQGEFVTAGIDYLYACPVFWKRLRLELSLGVGYFYSLARSYEVYTEGGKGYKDKDMAKRIQFFGPTKANVTLVIPIYCKKGGKK